MKLRMMLIVGLLIASLIVPALAAERTSEGFPETFSGNHKVTVTYEKVVEKDTSDIYPPQNYPPVDYKFVTLYYSLYNPTDSDIKYEFNVDVQDQNGIVFKGENFNIWELVPSKGSLLNRYKEYAIYRNSTQYQFVWHDKGIDAPWLDTTTYVNVTFPEPTPEPANTISASAQPTATPAPTQVPITQRCLPFLPLGIVIGGFGGIGLVSKNFLKNRR